MEFDYIIIGAGSAGCVLANRLSTDPRNRVLVLEAGPKDRNVWLKIPAGTSRVFSHPTLNWGLTSDPEPGLDDRRIYTPLGKTLGGSSAINGMVYMRGVPFDYDNWREKGAAGWSWQDVLPYFKKSERHFAGESALHGGGGELKVSKLLTPHPASVAFVEAAAKAGIPKNEDFNGPVQEGVGYLQYTIAEGIRQSAATAFLKPALRRKNLELQVNAQVDRVVFDGRRATGVRYSQSGKTVTARAKEILLCAGTFHTPRLLMLSGIGNGEHLAGHGIGVRHHLPGVGENLHDHIYSHYLTRVEKSFSINHIVNSPRIVPHVLRYLLTRKGLLTSSAAQVGMFVKSAPTVSTPDLQIQFRPFSFVVTKNGKFTTEPFPAVTASCSYLRPNSRGAVRLQSGQNNGALSFQTNYLTSDIDAMAMIEGIRWIRKVFSSEPMRAHVIGETAPGPAVETDEDILLYLRRAAQSMYHPVGTSRMGTDPMAVVDPSLKVHGIEGLRVVDASVMPQITSGNTNAPTIMIAEKAADLILRLQ